MPSLILQIAFDSGLTEQRGGALSGTENYVGVQHSMGAGVGHLKSSFVLAMAAP